MPAHTRSGFARSGLLIGLVAFLGFASYAIERLAHPHHTLLVSSGGYCRDGLGTRWGGVPDVLEVSPVRDALDLAENVPTVARINTAVFEVGYTGEPIQDTYALPRDLTINGVTQPLEQEMTIATGIYNDELTILRGQTVSFPVELEGARGIVDVTPLGQEFAGNVRCMDCPDERPILARFLLHDVTRR